MTMTKEQATEALPLVTRGDLRATGEVLKTALENTPALNQTAIADIATDMSADANANELKTALNAILARLRSAGIIVT